MSTQLFEGIVPGYFLELAGAARAGALDGVGDAVRVVEHLQPRLAAYTKLAAVDGMLWIALKLFGQTHLDQALLAATHDFRFALHGPHQQAAPGGTQGADAGLPGRDARDQLFFRDETDELLFGAATA